MDSWREKRAKLFELVKKVSDSAGGDSEEWLRKYVDELGDGAMECLQGVWDDIERYGLFSVERPVGKGRR